MDNEYILIRNKFIPKDLRTIFIAESPPSSGGYFYNQNGRVSEVLFRSIMDVILGFNPKTKHEGLQKFADEGYLLVDPIYIPVDKLPDKEADKLISGNYDNFVFDLRELTSKKPKVKIILIKANIIKLLEKKLLEDGFNVVNNGLMIPFPLHYHFPTFKERLLKLIHS